MLAVVCALGLPATAAGTRVPHPEKRYANTKALPGSTDVTRKLCKKKWYKKKHPRKCAKFH